MQGVLQRGTARAPPLTPYAAGETGTTECDELGHETHSLCYAKAVFHAQAMWPDCASGRCARCLRDVELSPIGRQNASFVKSCLFHRATL